MVYAGIDVHRKRSQVSVINAEGRELLNRNVDNGSKAMLDVLEDLEPGTPVAFEAAYGWGWLADLLDDHEPALCLTHAHCPSGATCMVTVPHARPGR